jgi:sporulation protein YlmC with PRC-barrel domain
MQTVEFTRDGKVILEDSGSVMTGTYELIGNDVVKVSLDGVSGAMLSGYGADSWEYTISGNIMTIQIDGESTTLTRIGASTPQQSVYGTKTLTIPPPPNQQRTMPISESTSMKTTASVTTPNITINAPKGGETWYIGNRELITWSSVNSVGQILLDVSYDSGKTWTAISTPIEDTGNFGWTVTGLASTHCRIRVEFVDSYSNPLNYPAFVSVADFTISQITKTTVSIVVPNITINAPKGGEAWFVGDRNLITWNSVNSVGQVLLAVSYDSGKTWTAISTPIDNSGSFGWWVTGLPSTHCRI